MQSRLRLSSHVRRALWCLWGAAALTWTGAAVAQAEAASADQGFVLDAVGCPPELTLDLERLVRIELESGKYENRSAIDIRVECEENLVTLTVTGEGRPAAKWRLDLSRTAESVHARVLSLAIAELIREQAGRPPPSKPPRPSRPPPPPRLPAKPPPPPPPPPKPEAPAPVGELEVFFALSQFDFSNEIGPGGGLRFWYLRLAPWHLAIDFSAGTLGRDVELGSVRLLSGSLGVRLGYTLRMADWALRFGAGQRTGVARVSGDSMDASRAVSGSVAGPFTMTLGYFALDTGGGGPFRAGLGAELGGVLVPVRGRIENEDDFGVDGLWAALEVRLLLAF